MLWRFKESAELLRSLNCGVSLISKKTSEKKKEKKTIKKNFHKRNNNTFKHQNANFRKDFDWQDDHA
jgi:hypothetical protein